jgi:hypothetical protein
MPNYFDLPLTFYKEKDYVQIIKENESLKIEIAKLRERLRLIAIMADQ